MILNEPRHFSIKTFNKTIWFASYMAVKYFKSFKKINKKFRSQIMMAVTNVNGCKACSYYHTSELIKAGSSEDEASLIKEGKYEFVDKKNSLALLFAQHYADKTGVYEQDNFDRLKIYYGVDKAHGILVAIAFIMVGNIYGISFGNMWDRMRFKKVQNANFFTDLYKLTFLLILFPIFTLINLFRRKRVF